MCRRQNRKAGLALILVMLVLAALVAVAAPFLVSMVQHEGTTRNYLDDVKAQVAAENARTSAIVSLLRTHKTYEQRKDAKKPFDTPEVDTLEEFVMAKGLLNLPKETVTLDPRGIMWDGKIEDEQGKINLRSAPRHTVDNLLQLVDPRTTRLERYVTEFSGRPVQWAPPRRIHCVGTTTLPGGKTVSVLAPATRLFSPICVAPGTRVRISDGNTSFIAYSVLDCKENLTLSCAIPPTMNKNYLLVQYELRHPVNINTAPREVIAAVLMGLSVQKRKRPSRGGGGGMGVAFIEPEQPGDDSIAGGETGEVSQKEAVALAERLVKKTYKNLDEVKKVIEEAFEDGVISEWDKEAILLNIRNPSAIGLNDTGTVPFCVRSYDVYSVEAIGVVNSPAGTERASCTFREVMSVVPPGRQTWVIKSQYDFEEMMNLCGSNHVVAGPNFDYMAATPGWNLWKETAGDLRVACPPDKRGIGVCMTESFEGTYDGRRLDGPLTYDFSNKTVPSPQPGEDIPPGGVEFWIKPDALGTGRTYFFDFAQAAFENRISLYYDGRDLVMAVSDATVDRWEAQVRHPIRFEPNTWYHLGAYWKSTSYGQLCLTVDGMPVGTFAHTDESGTKVVARLSGNISETATTIPVTTTAGFPLPAMVDGIPRRGVIEIGDEAIEYSGMTATSFTNCVRGARGTTARSHVNGATVTIYGYSNKLSSEGVQISVGGGSTPILSIDLSAGIPLVKGFLADSIGERPEAVINRPPASPHDAGGITDTDTTIRVAPNTDGFPSRGFIKVGSEVIYYGSKTATTFENCQRGAPLAEPTIAQSHENGTPVVLFAIPITDISGYPNPAIVQIDDEWIAGRPMVAQEDGKGYLMGWIFGRMAVVPPLRGDFFETGQASHSADAKVIPVFSTAEPECGRGDRVTIVQADQTQWKEQMEVRNAKPRRTIEVSVGGMQAQITISNLVAFMDFTRRAYKPDGINRLLKFPSGELPSFVTGQIQVCGVSSVGTGDGRSAATGATGTIDELRFLRKWRNDFRLATAVDGRTLTLQLNTLNGIEGNGGAVKVGDEVIGFARTNADRRELENCTRGYLGTTPSVHGAGARVFNLSFFGISPLAADVSSTAAEILLADSRGFPPEGYLLVGNEVIGYYTLAHSSEGAIFFMPTDKDGKGMYRGAYGTDAADHATNDLAYAIPFRYWDRYSPHSYDESMVCFHATLPVIDATWKRIYWVEGGDSDDPNLDVHMKVRIDSCGEWEQARPDAIVAKAGRVFTFNEPAGKNTVNSRGSRAEIRCLFEYRKGSFHTNSWKRTIFIEDIFFDYDAKITTLFRKRER